MSTKPQLCVGCHSDEPCLLSGASCLERLGAWARDHIVHISARSETDFDAAEPLAMLAVERSGVWAITPKTAHGYVVTHAPTGMAIDLEGANLEWARKLFAAVVAAAPDFEAGSAFEARTKSDRRDKTAPENAAVVAALSKWREERDVAFANDGDDD